uniref:LRRCT domain-containing protein n=1 Tax=Branchiostoma floridae TaxID=7739 RepID=C3YXF7_BRAFL|eukprot:XP_002598754.1 hypothetical protein BRAFLDRAFT_74570 [Branchiostoma floridae]
MGGKLRHLLMFLLIILKESNMPEAGCSCAPSGYNCTSRGLTSIPQNLPTNISSLDMGHNLITGVYESELVQYRDTLKTLKLRSNQITIIQAGTFANLPRLQEVNLASNQITDVQAGAFANLPSLEMLCLSNNNITTIQSGLFANLPQLQDLFLHENQITVIHPGSFVDLIHLERLFLQVNKITTIQSIGLAHLSQIQILDLCRNQITVIQPDLFANLIHLKKLLLFSNKITMIQAGTFANLPQLQELKLLHNQITDIQAGSFANLPRLEVLLLSQNEITEIHPGTFANLTHLKGLYMEHNTITVIQAGAFTNLPRLRLLFLARNKITTIQAGAFENLTNLKFLVLHSNQIATIHSGAFSNLRHLQHLGLSNNKMSAFAPLAYGLFPSNLVIQLYKNPWQCDCKMLPFRLNTTGFSSVTDQIICAQPAKLQGQKLTNVNPEELKCKEPTMPTLPVDVRVTSSNHHSCSTDGSRVGYAGKIGATLASPFQTTPDKSESKSCHVDTHVASNNDNNGTTAGSTRSPKGKRGKTRATLASPLQTTSDKPASSSSSQSAASFPSPALIASFCASVAGAVLLGSIILIIWCKRRTSHPPLALNVKGTNSAVSVITSGHDQTGQGQSQAIIRLNANTTTPIVSGHDHLYEDVDNHHNQTGQGQFENGIQSLKATNLSRNKLLAALNPNPMYEGERTPPADPASTSDHNQTGHGPSEAIIKPNPNTTTAVLTSGHDQQYEDMSPQNSQTGQGQAQVSTESNTNTTATISTSGNDHQYGEMNEYNQTFAESLDFRNPSYGTGPTPSQLNFLYKAAGQHQAINKSSPNTPAGGVTSGHDQQCEDQQHNLTG